MLKTILLPLDGSSLAERALIYAAALAQRSGARVVLVEAVQAHTFPGADPGDAQSQITDRAEAYLSSLATRLTGDGIDAEPHVYYDQPVNAIADAARRHQADVIVMSTHGRSGLGRMVYGSVADQVLRHAAIPVLLVPSVVEHTWPTDRPLSLLVPLDGSALSEAALPAAELFAEAFESRLALLSVVELRGYPLYGDGSTYVPFDEDAERAEAREYLDQRIAELHDHGRDASASVVVGLPPALIPAIAREQDVDVIVMATHGSSGLTRLLLGSVATSTLQHTPVPLLLVRPLKAASVEATHADATEDLAANAEAVALPAGLVSATVNVPLSVSDLDLIERGLKTVAYMPGFDYHRSCDVRALLDRLAEVPRESEPVAPAATREPVGAP
jgi:nucleotide-binding universal stress UspA family protein